MTLGQRLYELRKMKNLSQEKVAENLNVTRQTVSKWETDQSTPDFDKIVPICELYGITTQELLTGEKSEEKSEKNYDKYSYYQIPEEEESNKIAEENTKLDSYRKRHAIIVAVSVFLYITSATVLIGCTVLAKSPIMGLILGLLIVAVATMLIVFSSMSKPKVNHKKPNKETKLYKQITGILSGIVFAVYMIISFLSGMWHITWIIWVIYAIICEIIKLVFTLKGAEIHEDDE